MIISLRRTVVVYGLLRWIAAAAAMMLLRSPSALARVRHLCVAKRRRRRRKEEVEGLKSRLEAVGGARMMTEQCLLIEKRVGKKTKKRICG